MLRVKQDSTIYLPLGNVKELDAEVFFLSVLFLERGENENTNGLISQYIPKVRTSARLRMKCFFAIENLTIGPVIHLATSKTPWII